MLAAELGISPITLRQSLAALRTKGLIETSRGRSGGSVIRRQIELTDTQLQDKLRETSTETLQDLGDLGAAISSMSARLAAMGALRPVRQRRNVRGGPRRHRGSDQETGRRRRCRRRGTAQPQRDGILDRAASEVEDAPRRRCMTWRP